MNFKLIPLLGFILALAGPQPALAGNDKGNGGNVVLCKNTAGNVRSAELLDFYEARTMRDIPRDLGPSNLGMQKKIEWVLKRLAKFSPTRAATYLKEARSFLSEARMLRGIQLGDIGDSDHILVPQGCTVEQAVNQREPEFPEDRRYIINADLWDLLDDENRAGLILHELIYRELKQPTSVKSRYFNSYITSARLEALSLPRFIDLLRSVGLNSVDIQGVLVDLGKSFEFHPNQSLHFAHPIPGSDFLLQGQAVTFCRWISDSEDPTIEFFEDGGVQRICFDGTFTSSLKSGTFAFSASPGLPLQFHGNGIPEFGRAEFSSSTRVQSPTYDLNLGVPYHSGGGARPARMSFDSTGGLKYLEYARGKVLAQDHWVEVHEDYRSEGVVLHSNGKLQSGYLEKAEPFQVQGKSALFSKKVILSENDALLQGTLQSNGERFTIRGAPVRFQSNEEMHFYPNGQVRCGTLFEETTLFSKEAGKNRRYTPGTHVCFNEKEEVGN